MILTDEIKSVRDLKYSSQYIKMQLIWATFKRALHEFKTFNRPWN